MKFRIHGESKENAARMTLEIEAESKAAAERKAINQGMVVRRIEDITDGSPRHAIVQGGSRRSSGIDPLIKLIVLLAIIAAAWYFWPHLRGMLKK